MPYSAEHSARIIEPSRFQKDSFRRKNIETGIDIIIGKLKGQTTMTTQAYRFKKDKFTVSQAKKWLKDHNIDYISFEAAKQKHEAMIKVLDKEIKEVDERKGIVQIYVNAFGNEDSDGDISVKGSFAKTTKENMSRIKHFLNHNPDKLLGVPLEFKEDDFGLLVTSQMSIKKQLVKDVFADYLLFAEHNKTLEHSVRVEAIKRKDEDKRKVTEWKLWEYSTLYSWGANERTPLVSIKSMDDLELMLEKGHYSDEKSKKIEQLYEQLKNLLDKPQSTSLEPESTIDDELVKYYFNNIKF